MGSFLQGPTSGATTAATTISTLYSAGVPVGIPSSGNIGNNGALTGLTAFATTYPNIYLFFPAGAIAAGSAAGFYFCQMSSTTAGTIFNNALPAGTKPTIPATPTPFVTTGPGAYVQSTSVQILAQPVITGGAMGNNGLCQVSILLSTNATVNNKTINTLFGGTSIGSSTGGGAGVFWNIFDVQNQGQANRQVFLKGGYALATASGFGAIAGANTFANVNTANNFNIEVDGTLSTATDYIVLESFSVQLSSQP